MNMNCKEEVAFAAAEKKRKSNKQAYYFLRNIDSEMYIMYGKDQNTEPMTFSMLPQLS